MTKQLIRFIHLADIHLDSPLRGLEAHDEAPVDEIRSATRRAFQNCIDLAIEEQFDFILIAGDLYDGDWKDYNTGIFFATQMGRLKNAGVLAFIVSGNHDAASQITRTMPLPDNVTFFPADKTTSIKIDHLGVVIHGRSYASRAVTENLASQFPECDPCYLNIGLLHTSLTGREGHESYAPCTLGDLRSKGYDYWALGHVHKREIVFESPWVVFPGNIQGRHIGETGVKGATLVTIEENHIKEVKEQELDVVRFQKCQVDLSHCETANCIYDAVRQAFLEQQNKAANRLLALRLLLTGKCPVHSLLLERTTAWTEEFRGIAAGLGNIWLEKVKFNTSRTVQLDELTVADTPFSGLLQSIKGIELDTDTLSGLVPELAGLKNKLPPEIYSSDDPFLASTPEAIEELRAEVQELLIAKLLQQQGTQ